MPAHAERPLDALDALAAGGTVDLHADTPLHNLVLAGDGAPRRAMRTWMGFVQALGRVFPRVSNFTRQLTRESFEVTRKGVQVFSAVTRGLPPFYQASHRTYAAVADWPAGAAETSLNAWMQQAVWAYRETAAHPERLVWAPELAQVRDALQAGKVAVQLGIEGAFPFDPSEADTLALSRFLDAPGSRVPVSFPRPSQSELCERGGLMRYARRLGVQYVSLSHLASSCFMGSGLRPNRAWNGGLTEQGRALIGEMVRAGVMVDLAHASQAAQAEVVALVESGEYPLPLIVSHGIVALPGMAQTFRTTSPAALDAVRASGGVIGVMAAKQFLPHGAATDPELIIRDVADQVDEVRRAIGVDCIALGLDADGFVGLPYPTAIEVSDALRRELAKRGYSEAHLTKIYGGNYLRLLSTRERGASETSARRLSTRS